MSRDEISHIENFMTDNVGVGLRTQHLAYFADNSDKITWLEIHPENYLSDGGYRIELLQDIIQDYPISCHSVGMSIGSACGVDKNHVKQLRKFYDWCRPFVVSDHLSWSGLDGNYYNDLLPIPMTNETLDIFIDSIKEIQDILGRQMLVENPSLYVGFRDNHYQEGEFLGKLAEKSGCGLLLDVNNIYVGANNLKSYSSEDYINDFPIEYIQEIHLAGHAVIQENNDIVLIDNHGHHVCDDVWDLYRLLIKKTGPLKTLIEWDTDVPSPEILLHEASKAQYIMDNINQKLFRHAS